MPGGVGSGYSRLDDSVTASSPSSPSAAEQQQQQQQQRWQQQQPGSAISMSDLSNGTTGLVGAASRTATTTAAAAAAAAAVAVTGGGGGGGGGGDDTFDLIVLDQKACKHALGGMRLTTTVAQLKATLAALPACAVPPSRQRLIFMGRVLADGATLGASRVKPGNTVHLFARAAEPPPPALASALHGGGAHPQDNQMAADERMARGMQGPGGGAWRGGGMGVRGGHGRAGMGLAENLHGGMPEQYPNMAVAEAARRVKLWSSLLLVWSLLQLFSVLVGVADSVPEDGGATPSPSPSGGGGGGGGDALPTCVRNPCDPACRTLAERLFEAALNYCGAYSGLWGFRAATRFTILASTKHYYSLVAYSALYLGKIVECFARIHAAGRTAAAAGGGEAAATTSDEQWYLSLIIPITIPLAMFAYCVRNAGRFRRGMAPLAQPAAGAAAGAAGAAVAGAGGAAAGAVVVGARGAQPAAVVLPVAVATGVRGEGGAGLPVASMVRQAPGMVVAAPLARVV
jgi:hypothetical protein